MRLKSCGLFSAQELSASDLREAAVIATIKEPELADEPERVREQHLNQFAAQCRSRRLRCNLATNQTNDMQRSKWSTFAQGAVVAPPLVCYTINSQGIKWAHQNLYNSSPHYQLLIKVNHPFDLLGFFSRRPYRFFLPWDSADVFTLDSLDLALPLASLASLAFLLRPLASCFCAPRDFPSCQPG